MNPAPDTLALAWAEYAAANHFDTMPPNLLDLVQTTFYAGVAAHLAHLADKPCGQDDLEGQPSIRKRDLCGWAVELLAAFNYQPADSADAGP